MPSSPSTDELTERLAQHIHDRFLSHQQWDNSTDDQRGRARRFAATIIEIGGPDYAEEYIELTSRKFLCFGDPDPATAKEPDTKWPLKIGDPDLAEIYQVMCDWFEQNAFDPGRPDPYQYKSRKSRELATALIERLNGEGIALVKQALIARLTGETG